MYVRVHAILTCNTITAILQQADLDKRMQAIRELTKELLQHRDVIVKGKTTRAELLRELTQNQEAAKVTIQKQELATIPRDVLEKSYTEMSVRHSVETRRLKEYGSRVPDLQNKVIERNEIEKAHLRLEGVHRRQGTCMCVRACVRACVWVGVRSCMQEHAC